MFVRYDYIAGSTSANIVADIVKLMTGTTDKTLLSSNAYQLTTVITDDGTRPGGWTVYDAAAGVNMVCLRALNLDGVSYKYIVVNHATTLLTFQAYESWNATTHVGTNLCYLSNTTGPLVNLTLGGTIFMSCSKEMVMAIGWVNAVYDTYPTCVVEHERYEPWDTPAFGVPPFLWFNGGLLNTPGPTSSMGAKPRIKNGIAADNTGLSASVVQAICPYGSTVNSTTFLSSTPRKQIRDASYTTAKHAMCIPLCFTGNITYENQIFGPMREVYATTLSFGLMGDEIQFNGKTYFIIAYVTTGRLAVPKF